MKIMENENMLQAINQQLFTSIKSIISNSRKLAYQNVNRELILTYWKIGAEIVQMERQNNIDSKTSSQIILKLSKVLSQEMGKGFSRSNLFNMRKFYLEYPAVQSVTGHISWTHICELLVIENRDKRSFYEKESINASWSVREMKRQIESSLYERLALSSGRRNKEKIMELSRNGHEVYRAEDLIKNPYVFEFLGIPEIKPLLEKDLEAKLIRHIEAFLLELGKGFMFVGSQQRITINNTHYYVDMVFYNKVLRCYILIELKTTKLNIADAGQLNTYLNYYKSEVNDPTDNPPMGIILCTEKDEITAEYILGGFENTVFASRYTTILPDKQRLIDEVENVLNK